MGDRPGLRALYEAYLRKRPKQSRSRSVVEAVLQAATEALSKGHREDRLTVQQVAERAGVGIGSLYDYFGDRGSVLAGLAAKITEDNLRELEEELARVESAPLEVAIDTLLDDLFTRYLGKRPLGRAVLRIAHSIDLMPTLAESQALFAKTLGSALRRRDDVKVPDPERTAFLMTNMTMGLLHTLVWSPRPPEDEQALKREVARIWVQHLRAG
jgi:AcrR family transcriptional regulator